MRLRTQWTATAALTAIFNEIQAVNSVFTSSSLPVSASSGSGQSSLTKISVAQVLLLLDTISEKQGKAKWDIKAEQIKKVHAL